LLSLFPFGSGHVSQRIFFIAVPFCCFFGLMRPFQFLIFAFFLPLCLLCCGFCNLHMEVSDTLSSGRFFFQPPHFPIVGRCFVLEIGPPPPQVFPNGFAPVPVPPPCAPSLLAVLFPPWALVYSSPPTLGNWRFPRAGTRPPPPFCSGGFGTVHPAAAFDRGFPRLSEPLGRSLIAAFFSILDFMLIALVDDRSGPVFPCLLELVFSDPPSLPRLFFFFSVFFPMGPANLGVLFLQLSFVGSYSYDRLITAF